MTTALLQSEILRFLSDPTPEVLCIRGHWGVGKTYAWLKYLGEAEKAKKLQVKQYAYVSLFGLNTLNDLRYAIFESTVTTDQYLAGPDIRTLEVLLSKGMDWGRKARPFLDTIGSMLGRKEAGEALARASFLLVKGQLVCLDDLERAGDGLKQRDILGLASFLKEQRKCKVVLLLNDEQMEEEQRKEFDRQVEKVVDVNLRFDPTSSEAVGIALDATDPLSSILTPPIVKLGIVNIRVIKKIERMARLLSVVLAPCGDAVVYQAVATVTLGGWSVLQPNAGPTIDFLRGYGEIGFSMKAVSGKLTEDEERFYRLLKDYGYNETDQLDGLILDGIARGAFDEAAILDSGYALQKLLAEQTQKDTFSAAWDQFHGDLSLDDDKLLDNLYKGALDNLTQISPLNINGTVKMLREMGRADQADELTKKYVDARGDDRRIFDLSDNHFIATAEVDPAVAKAFADKLDSFVDGREPTAVLLEMYEKQGWSPLDLELLATVTSDGFVEFVEGLRGPEVRRVIEFLQLIGRQPDKTSQKVGITVSDALTRIAAKSPLRALRMRRFGVGGPAPI